VPPAAPDPNGIGKVMGSGMPPETVGGDTDTDCTAWLYRRGSAARSCTW